MQTIYLTRREAAAYVTQRGLKLSSNTLQKMASRGGGPLYSIFGRNAVYTPQNLDAWIETKISRPRRSTSEITGDAYAVSE